MIKFKNTPKWEIADAGVHDAVVVDVVGNNADEHGAEAIRVVWEVAQARTAGIRLTVTKIYHNAASFIHDFKNVLGDNHPLITGRLEDIEWVIGAACRVVIVHNPKRDGTMFPHVSAVLKAEKVSLVGSDRYVRLAHRHTKPKEQAKVIVPLPKPDKLDQAA